MVTRMAFVGYFNSAPPLNEALDRGARKFESLAASNKFVGSVFILLLMYMMYSSTRGISIYDEGLICYGADRLLAGDGIAIGTFGQRTDRANITC